MQYFKKFSCLVNASKKLYFLIMVPDIIAVKTAKEAALLKVVFTVADLKNLSQEFGNFQSHLKFF